MIAGTDEICHDYSEEKVYDLFFSLDCADEKRLGRRREVFEHRKTDHLYRSPHQQCGFCGSELYPDPDASSTSEIVFNLLDEDKITFESAEALYMGIVHDTGVLPPLLHFSGNDGGRSKTDAVWRALQQDYQRYVL